MPIVTKKPHTDANGNVYPFLSVNLIVRPALTVDRKDYTAPVVLNLLPFRVLPDGTIIEAPQSAMRSMVMRDAYAAAAHDPALAEALGTIFNGIGAFINAKEL